MSEFQFYLPEDKKYPILESVKDSVNFVLKKVLTKYKGHICAKSTFVDCEGNPQPWHEFGSLEGIGWVCNAVGGSYELYKYAQFTKDKEINKIALSILDHCLEDGFINYENGFITPYRDIVEDKFYFNYLHCEEYNQWFCVGSVARIAYQFLVFSDLIGGETKREKMINISIKSANWIEKNVELAPNGWYPRRSTPEGKVYDKDAYGRRKDPEFDHSGDGLFILQLMTDLTKRSLVDYRKILKEKTDLFMDKGDFYGSINHDTYDDEENLAYAVAFLVFEEIANLLEDERIREFAYEKCLAGLKKFEIKEDRNGVETKGLLYMEKSWDTAYIQENAEASLAYLKAYSGKGEEEHLKKGLTILRAIAKHHHGKYGFLTEGVDWNNQVGAKNHFDNLKYGDIKYTEPFLPNLHIIEPTLYYLEEIAKKI